MKTLVAKTVFLAMDGVMHAMMNTIQWRRNADTCTLEKFEKYLAAHSHLTREEFYPLYPAVEVIQTGGWMEWASPLPTGHAENDRVRVRFYPAPRRDAPTVLLLHGLMSADDGGYRRVAAWFNARGWSVAFPHLPYHYSRTPRRMLNGELAVTADLVRNIEGVRQSVVEFRQLLGLLRARGSAEFGLLGTSYGGWTGALLSFLEKDFRFVALVQPIANVDKAIWENPGASSMRRSLSAIGHAPGNTSRFAHLSSPLHGTPLCDHRRIVITGGLYDRVSPLEELHSLSARWPGSQLIQVRQGHFGYRALRETLKKIEPFLDL